MVDRRELLNSALMIAAGGLARAGIAATEPGSKPDPTTLLQRVVQTYAAIYSYADSGTVTRYDPSESPYRIDFTTAYQSPSLFRFEFSTPHPYASLSYIVTKYDVGYDGTAAYFISTPYQEAAKSVPTKNLNLALARATGISAGAAHTISRLLLRDISGTSMLDLIAHRFSDDATIDGVACYSISAQHPRGGEWQLWVEKDTLLLRKLRTNFAAQDASYSEEVRQDIRINQPIDPSRFKVDV